MTEKDQIYSFAHELDNLVARYRAEYELSYASVVGVLQMKSHLLCSEAADLSDDEG